jgi:hypothetical protein
LLLAVIVVVVIFFRIRVIITTSWCASIGMVRVGDQQVIVILRCTRDKNARQTSVTPWPWRQRTRMLVRLLFLALFNPLVLHLHHLRAIGASCVPVQQRPVT